VEKVNYRNEDIHIYFIRGKEAPKCIKEASKAVPVSDRRTSKRSRRTSSENLVSLKVSSSTSVYHLNLLGVCYRSLRRIRSFTKVMLRLKMTDKIVFFMGMFFGRETEIYENRETRFQSRRVIHYRPRKALEGLY